MCPALSVEARREKVPIPLWGMSSLRAHAVALAAAGNGRRLDLSDASPTPRGVKYSAGQSHEAPCPVRFDVPARAEGRHCEFESADLVGHVWVEVNLSVSRLEAEHDL